MEKEVLLEGHNSMLTGAHSGIFKTTERLKGQFWWPGMDKAIKNHVASCPACGATSNKFGGRQPPQTQLPLPPGPNWRVHADLFGPLKDEDGANQWILVMTCAFTKIVSLRVVPAKDSSTLANAMLEGWIYVQGVPKVILTDQGTEFCNDLQREVWKVLQISHQTTTPYHPQCNSQAEVFNRTMKRCLQATIKQAEESTVHWRKYLYPLMFAYNTSVHKAAPMSS
jgi:hypothetical protein